MILLLRIYYFCRMTAFICLLNTARLHCRFRYSHSASVTAFIISNSGGLHFQKASRGLSIARAAGASHLFILLDAIVGAASGRFWYSQRLDCRVSARSPSSLFLSRHSGPREKPSISPAHPQRISLDSTCNYNDAHYQISVFADFTLASWYA